MTPQKKPEENDLKLKYDNLYALVRKLVKIWQPPPDLTVSTWADEYRRLSAESSSEPGRWSTDRAPYQRGPMDAINESEIETIVLMTSTQTMKTEVLLNIVGYFIDQDPSSMLYVMSTLDLAKAFSKERLAPMIRDTPVLRDKIADSKSRDSENAMLHKHFPGGFIVIGGANSPDSLAFRPVRILLMDEVDRYKASAGAEGDPVNLARKRTTNFYNRKIVLASSPTMRGGSRIEEAYEQSDKRVYEVPCPHCKKFQTLRWPQLQWEKNDPLTALYYCVGCGQGIEEKHKSQMVSEGRWVKTGITNNKTAGFLINELYSPWVRWAEMVVAWQECQGRPEELKVFINTRLAETFEEKGDAPEWERIFSRREDYERNTLPTGALLLVAGADVQKDRIEVEIKAYGRDFESWSIDYRVFPGKPEDPEIWQRLESLLNEQFDSELGGKSQISMLAIDSGWATNNVYMFGRKMGPSRVMVVKGRDSMSALISAPKAQDINFAGKKIQSGVQLWHVGVKIAKSELYSYLRTERVNEKFPPGYMHFPEYEEEYFRQLTAEALMKRKLRTGAWVFQWQKIRERNEVLDCHVYARCAAALMGLDRFTEREWAYLEAQLRVSRSINTATLDVNRPQSKRIVRRQISKGVDMSR